MFVLFLCAKFDDEAFIHFYFLLKTSNELSVGPKIRSVVVRIYVPMY